MAVTNAQPGLSFSTANPHALASIMEASETQSIIASRDIFDISGTKLWARDQPVSHALQRKLLDRQLRHPLESCLLAEDGVTALSLVRSVEALMAHDSPLTDLLRPHAAKLVRETAYVYLHPVAQLLLTAGRAARQPAFEHAVEGMALAGVLMMAQGGGIADVRTAMLCGLLHDVGEMYIDPQFGEADVEGQLDVHSYQHLVVHPHVGGLLVEQLTDYPRVIARAISEHHEKLDGSGYPRRLSRDDVSPLGRLLCVTEGALCALRREGATLARASVSLRVVPGEYDMACIGPISQAAHQQPQPQAARSVAEIQGRLTGLELTLQAAQDSVAVLLDGSPSPSLKDALHLAGYLLGRLRAGWNASGLWSQESLTEADAPEIEAVEDELLSRLWGIQRAVMLRAGKLHPNDQQSLLQLFDDIGSAVD
jgi:hypothetical protein